VADEESTSSSLAVHPDPETLFDYLAGQVPSDEADRLREHFASCPDCCGVLLAVESYEGLAEELGIEAGEQATVWSRIEERIAPGASVRMPRHRRSAFLPWALAASLLLASVGLSFRVASLQGRVVGLSSPSTAAVIDLLPEGEVLRGGPADAVKLPRDSSNVVLILNTFETRPFSAHKVVLKDGERIVWIYPDLRPNHDGYFALTVPQAWCSISTGRLQIELYGQADGQEELIGTYSAQFE
jgi:hypothetical protein